jgi:hypothetical protein
MTTTNPNTLDNYRVHQLLVAAVDDYTSGVTSPEQLTRFLKVTSQHLRALADHDPNIDDPAPLVRPWLPDFLGAISKISLNASASPGCSSGGSRSTYELPYTTQRLQSDNIAWHLRRFTGSFDRYPDMVANLTIAAPMLECQELIDWTQNRQLPLAALAAAIIARSRHDRTLAAMLGPDNAPPVTIIEAIAAQAPELELLAGLAPTWEASLDDLVATYQQLKAPLS